MTIRHHLPCPTCHSRDALSDYGDHTHCFSCHTTIRSGDSSVDIGHAPRDPPRAGLITDVEFKRIPIRGLHAETCKKFGYGLASGKHVAPYYKNGTLVAQKIRGPNKDFYVLGDIKGCELFGQHLWRNSGGKRIVITEGEIDCLSVAQSFNLNWPVVSVVNGASGAKKNIQDNLEFLESYSEIVLWFDNDDPGRKATEECAGLFTPGKCRVVLSTGGHKDANEVLTKEGTSDVTKIVWEAKVHRPDGIISGDDPDLYKRLVSFRDGTDGAVSFSIPYPCLDGKIRGLRKKRLYTIIAAPKVGKSTLTKELGYHLLMNHNLKIASFAIEESIEDTSMIFMGMYAGKRLQLEPKGVSSEVFDCAYKATVGNGRLFLFDHFGSLDPDNLFSKFRYMAVGLGVDFILFDHVSIVVSGLATDNERRLIDNIETKLRSLIQETGVGVIQVAHIKKGSGESSDPEEGGKVSASDIRGSGIISQISDFVIAMEGDTQDESNLRRLRVIYNRLSGDSGEADTLEFNKETGRLSLVTL